MKSLCEKRIKYIYQFFCELCGGLYNGTGKHQKVCSECRPAALRLYQSQYYMDQRAKKAAENEKLDRLKGRVREHEAAIKKLRARIDAIERRIR